MKIITPYIILVAAFLLNGCGDQLSAEGKVQQLDTGDLVFMVRHLSAARKASLINKQLVNNSKSEKLSISDYNNYHFFDFRIQFEDKDFLQKLNLNQENVEEKRIGQNVGLLPFYLRDDFRKSFYLQYKGQRLECILISALPMSTDENSITYSLTFLDREFENQKSYFKENIALIFENKAFSKLPITFEYKAEVLNQA